MLAFIGNFYQKAAVCLSPCTFGFINRNNAAGNIIRDYYCMLKISKVLKKILIGLKVMLNAPKAVTLDVGYALFIKINVSVFLTDADIFVRKAVFFFGKFGFSLICSADYKIHKVPSFLKVTSLK